MIVTSESGRLRTLRLPGVRLVYEFQEGEDYYVWGGFITITHPERAPKILHADGTIEELKL